MLFVFIISFDNFTPTFFWVGTDAETLPIVIYSKIRIGLDPTIDAIGTIIVVFSLSIEVAAEKLSARLVERPSSVPTVTSYAVRRAFRSSSIAQSVSGSEPTDTDRRNGPRNEVALLTASAAP